MSSTDTPAPAEGATLAERIAEAMAEAGGVTKSDENREQGYKFASAESILKAVREPLLSRGILLFPTVDELDEQEIRSSKGTLGTRVVIRVTYRFTDGRETLETSWRGEGQDYGDKAYGKAYTNALKTFIRSAWLLPTEHDDAEARPPGERVAGPAPAEAVLPGWSRAASRERLAELTPLATVLGTRRAGELVRALRDTFDGTVPDIAVTILNAAHGQYVAALEELGLAEDAVRERIVLEDQAAKDAERRAAEAAQAAAEGPDTPAPEPTDEPRHDPNSVDDAERGAAMAQAPEPDEEPPDSFEGAPRRPAAGTVPPPDPATAEALRAAGCSCNDPLAAARCEDRLKAAGDETLDRVERAAAAKAADAAKALVDDNCPIRGHGIGF